MRSFAKSVYVQRGILAGLALLLAGASPVAAGGKFGAYVIRMIPDGKDAENFSQTSWGGGIHAVVPVPQVSNIIAGTVGIEIIDMLSETFVFQDGFTGLRVEQQTNQTYFRFYLGGQVGGHGHGFLRPHVGVNLAVVNYGIKTDVVVPDDSDRERDIRQKLRSESQTVFGYDITLGLDMNFNDGIALDGGVRYVKSFGLPQQLGDGSETIHPQYFQVYLGIGLSFNFLKKLEDSNENDGDDG